MQHTITTADICELAHHYTCLECMEKDIAVDQVFDNETRYSEQAQEIFDRHYKIIETYLGI